MELNKVIYKTTTTKNIILKKFEVDIGTRLSYRNSRRTILTTTVISLAASAHARLFSSPDFRSFILYSRFAPEEIFKMGKCTFSQAWLNNGQYQSWIARTSDGSKSRARCRLCQKDFDVSNMGEAALKSHMSGKKHVLLAQTASKSTCVFGVCVHVCVCVCVCEGVVGGSARF